MSAPTLGWLMLAAIHSTERRVQFSNGAGPAIGPKLRTISDGERQMSCAASDPAQKGGWQKLAHVFHSFSEFVTTSAITRSWYEVMARLPSSEYSTRGVCVK